jgi:hypothetical protein
MSNLIERVVEALEGAKIVLNERCPFGNAEEKVDAALADLRRYEVVEGCVVTSQTDDTPVAFWRDDTLSDRDTPAILLVERAPAHGPKEEP